MLSPRCFIMKIRALISRVTGMKGSAWILLIRSLQLTCFLLICSLAMIYAFETGSGRYEFYIQSKALQEYAQVALLIGAILPVCLEDL